MRFSTIRVGEPVELDGRNVIPLPANHTVPAVGYQLDSGNGSLVFTGDTGPCPELWKHVNRIRNLRYLIIECAFSNREKPLAVASLHLCPSMLLEELTNLQRDAEVFITHLKPGQIELTMQEIEDCIGEFRPGMLQNNQIFEI
jgi:ribonuclease BN (tRNA processing enzyme)